MYHGLSLSKRHSTATRNVRARVGFLCLQDRQLRITSHCARGPRGRSLGLCQSGRQKALVTSGHMTLGSQASCVGRHFESGQSGCWERQCASPTLAPESGAHEDRPLQVLLWEIAVGSGCVRPAPGA